MERLLNAHSGVSRARLLVDLARQPPVHRYGEHPCQRADLHLPRGRGPHPVIVTIHGGGWGARWGKIVMRGLAADLARRGHAVWNIEYRRIGRGQGGGWPATFADVAAAIDHLEQLDAPLDLARVTLLGHSAGGQLAVWAAGRAALPAGMPGAEPRIMPVGVIAQAAMLDLSAAHNANPRGIVAWLLGGVPAEIEQRLAIVDPVRRVPLAVPALLVHGSEDRVVPVRHSRSYAAAARRAGGEVELVELPGVAGEHRRHIDPASPAWAQVTRRLHTYTGAGTAASAAPLTQR